MYCVMAPVAAVSAGALTFLVLPIDEIVFYCIVSCAWLRSSTILDPCLADAVRRCFKKKQEISGL